MRRVETEVNATDTLLCNLLYGGTPTRIEALLPREVEHFIEVARLHGVLPLLDRRFEDLSNRQGCPARILAACHEAAVAETVREVLRQRELLRVLDAFAGAGLRPLLLKGAALAYSHYPRASLRPRDDVDLLVRESARETASMVLASLGYASSDGVTGAYLSHQANWSRPDAHGVRHYVDLHWRVSNLQVLSRALDFEELEARAVPIPRLGPHARALAPVHALLFACMHRVAHKGDPSFWSDAELPGRERLIWLHDIRLLLTQMTAEEIDEFLALAGQKQLKAICGDALSRIADCAGYEDLLPILSRLEPASSTEPSEWLLHGHPVSRTMGELAGIDSVAGRAAWLWRRAFPSAGYMREYFAGTAVRWLPWMYVRRAARGLRKLVMSPRRGRAD